MCPKCQQRRTRKQVRTAKDRAKNSTVTWNLLRNAGLIQGEKLPKRRFRRLRRTVVWSTILTVVTFGIIMSAGYAQGGELQIPELELRLEFPEMEMPEIEMPEIQRLPSIGGLFEDYCDTPRRRVRLTRALLCGMEETW